MGKIEEFIVKHADGVFLWVRVIGDELENYCRRGLPPNGILRFLEALPKELEGYYEYILQGLSASDKDDIRDGTRILQFCLFSHRAVELFELRDALGIPGEIAPSSLDLTPFLWEGDRPGDIRSRLAYSVGCFVEIKGISGLHTGKPLIEMIALTGPPPSNILLTNLDPSCPQVDEQAVAQVMHQTVREFFLRPHKSVINSHFQNNISAQPAREMIAITCIRYLDLHYRELGNRFQSAATANVSSWSPKDVLELVRYLDSRPLIKYSLEFLMALKEDVNVDPDIPKPLLGLTTNLRLQNCPSALQICLLERLTDFSSPRVRELNRLLGIAAEDGYIVAVGNLLAAGAECNAALHSAAKGGNLTTVQLLLNRGADIEANESGERKPLHMAALYEREAAVGLLLGRGADIEANDSERRTLLHMAAQYGHVAAIGLLLDRGADIEASDSDRLTPLHIATGCGEEATIGFLLDRGADIGAKDSGGQTPLHIATGCGNEAIIGLLLERGADIEAKDSYERTPLHMFPWYGQEAGIRLLLNRGADIEAKGSNGRTLLDNASLCGRVAMVGLLLNRRADIEAKDLGGHPCLGDG